MILDHNGHVLQGDALRAALVENTPYTNTRHTDNLSPDVRKSLTAQFPDHFMPEAWRDLREWSIQCRTKRYCAEIYGIWDLEPGEAKRRARSALMITYRCAVLMVGNHSNTAQVTFRDFVYEDVGQRVAHIHAETLRRVVSLIQGLCHDESYFMRGNVDWSSALLDLLNQWAAMNAGADEQMGGVAQLPRRVSVWH